MVNRQFDLHDETDRILTELAREHQDNPGDVVADLVHAHKSLEDFAAGSEDAHRDLLQRQFEHAESGFREGRRTTWEEVKRRNGL